MKKIGIVTATRAEYGLLKPVIEKVYKDKELELHLIVTGMHLSPEFGMTYKEIEEDGYPIDVKVEMLLSADTPSSIVKSMGVESIGFADYFSREKPDILILLGDRYEILVAAMAATIFRIPIAHMHGGELTEGVIDEAVRHSISKMSFLHFTTTEMYRKRVIQMGEAPERVFVTGALGVESIKTLKLLEKSELEKRINFTFDKPVLMVTYHPVTLEKETAGVQFENLLVELDTLKDVKIIFTKANADTDGRIINQMIEKYVQGKENCVAFTSMGQLHYLSALQYCHAVIGNSSSGIIEVPSFYIPTVNIGDRQRGRVQAESVINCGTGREEIRRGIEKTFDKSFRKEVSKIKNPYEGENPSEKIVNVIKSFLENKIDIKKTFYDLEEMH